VLALGWVAGAALLPDARRATLCWALYAALSAASLLAFVVSVAADDEPLRAFANLCVVLSILMLQRGVWAFFDCAHRWAWHVLVAAVAVAVSWLGLDPAWGAWRIAVISGSLALLCLSTAWDLQREARARMALRWGVVLAVPLALGGLVFALRTGRALIAPDSVVAEMTADSRLNIGAALLYLVLTLAFQLTLVALVVTRLMVELQRNSRYDTLTGVLNRRAIEEALAAEVQRSRRLGESFSVLMVDADHFKAINDRQGHAAGDRALQHLGTLMTAQMRDIDRVGRWGGEEFVVLLPGTALQAAQEVGERLRERAAALPPRWQERPLPLTLSVGVSQWAGANDQLTALLARADTALYRAKAAGRNRVEADAPPGMPRIVVLR